MSDKLPLTARIIEIFASIQGEGVYLGQSHLFVRFWDCNMACRYCDTEYKGAYQEFTVEALVDEVRERLDQEGPFHAVSLTGGEPLLWVDFLIQALPELKALGTTTYLETNGTLPEALEAVLPWVDIVAMDWKPPTATGDEPQWALHEAFLQIALKGAADTFIKLILTAETSEADFGEALERIARISSDVPVVLQPVTPHGPVKTSPSPEQIAYWQGAARKRFSNVQVLPQIHKILGVA